MTFRIKQGLQGLFASFLLCLATAAAADSTSSRDAALSSGQMASEQTSNAQAVSKQMTTEQTTNEQAAGKPMAKGPDAEASAESEAGQQDLAEVRLHFEQRFPGVDVRQVQATPVAGLYELVIGMNIVYTDANVDYVIEGALIDAHTLDDLTARKLLKLTEVEFDSLPLDLAIKQVKGTGERQIAVFEDPNCGYCRQLHETLQDIDDITVYTLLFPILSPDSTVKARNIWCASDPAAAWKAWMLERKAPPMAECDAPIDDVLDLGRELMVRGTPAIIFADGSRVNGAMPLDQLQAQLDNAEKLK